MRFLRIWVDEQDVSHITELPQAFEPVEGYARGIPTVGVSAKAPGSDAYLLHMPRGFFGDWHPAPRRQLMAQLQGSLHVVGGDGVGVDAPTGTLLLVEDVTGEGHQTRVTSEEDVIFLVVGAPDGWAPA